MKNISFLSEFFQLLEVKFSVYLNRHVFVMIIGTNRTKFAKTTTLSSALYKSKLTTTILASLCTMRHFLE